MNGLILYDFGLGLGKAMRPIESLDKQPCRYSSNSPILILPHDAMTVYCGAEFRLRTRHDGMTWRVLSPDLTTADPDKMGEGTGPSPTW